MTDAKTWTHKGATIAFDAASAKFSATVRGKRLTATSLDAIKKKIDVGTGFDPFPCYLERRGWGVKADNPGVVAFVKGPCRGERALVEGTVIGVEPGRHRSSAPEFRIEILDYKGKKTETRERTVMARTPEAVLAWKAYWKASEAAEQAEADLKEANIEKLSPLHAAIPYRRAGED